MATKAELEQQIDDLLETNADLHIELSMSREKYGDLLTEFKESQEELAALKGNANVPWEDEPDWCEGAAPMPPVRSFKERCAEARARAMSTGKAVLV